MISAKWILLGLLVLLFGVCAFFMQRTYYYKTHYQILKKQQEYSSDQLQFLSASNSKMINKIQKEDEKLDELKYENSKVHRNRIPSDYIERLCRVAACSKKRSSASKN